MDYQLKVGSEFSSVDPPVVEPPPARPLHIDSVGGLPPSRAMRITGNVLRGVAAVLTFVAAIVMGTAAQTKRVVVIDDSGSPVTLAGTAKSHYSSALVGHSEGLKNKNKDVGKNFLYREYMSPVWQSLVTMKAFVGISDVVSSDGRNGEFPTYVCEWIQPHEDHLYKFVVRNNGICMVS